MSLGNHSHRSASDTQVGAYVDLTLERAAMSCSRGGITRENIGLGRSTKGRWAWNTRAVLRCPVCLAPRKQPTLTHIPELSALLTRGSATYLCKLLTLYKIITIQWKDVCCSGICSATASMRWCFIGHRHWALTSPSGCLRLEIELSKQFSDKGINQVTAMQRTIYNEIHIEQILLCWGYLKTYTCQ